MWGVDSVPHSKRGHWFFQLSFAAAASTIVSGAVAERCTLVAYAIYTSIISAIIYPLVSHWAWSEDGWLQVLGYRDLAGGGVVHLLGGNCALIGAVVLGSRIGRFEKSPVGQQNHFTISSTASNNNLMPCSLACAANPMPGHSSLLSGFGGLLLAVTFLAFNGASVGQVTGGNGQDASTAAIVAVNTILGGSGAIIAIMANLKAHSYFYPTCKSPEWDMGMIINAALSGMVSIH
ncbi:hypothetical protein J437_LFUL000430 [Ladona fulva]|uniref:Ammonium transporter AmtB-like domain-containing protein n=1 Tax=Ladona fulva TaxID=123851 RepID=A0A8K0NZ49_LADFU|nr:hypothetical protein J437_LFUL000430 [Ladona fulva]